MSVKTLESRSARENWRDLLDTANAGRSDVVITRYGKPITVMISYDDYVAVHAELVRLRAQRSEAYQTMLVSESILAREWDSPAEDEAWADL